MGKPIGTYITLEAPRMSEPDEDYHREVSEKLAEYLKKLLDVQGREVHTGGRLREPGGDPGRPGTGGSQPASRSPVMWCGNTEKLPFGRDRVHRISAIVPGVMAQTGMETLEVVRGIVAETKPD